jgi:hypothetical protein
MLMASVIVIEMPFDIFLQAIQLRALTGALLHTRTAW